MRFRAAQPLVQFALGKASAETRTSSSAEDSAALELGLLQETPALISSYWTFPT